MAPNGPHGRCRVDRLRAFDERVHRVVEATKQCTIEKFRVICRRHYQTARIILLEKLQKGIENPSNLANIVWLIPLCTYCIELIEKVDTIRRSNGIKHQFELRRGFTHKLRDDAFEQNGR